MSAARQSSARRPPPRLIDPARPAPAGPRPIAIVLLILAARWRWGTREFAIQRPWDGAPRGEEWRVLFYDQALELHFSGVGPDPWTAIAELGRDFERRGVRGLSHSPARDL